MPVPKHNLTIDDCRCIDRIVQTSEDKLQLAKGLQECGLPTDEHIAFFSTAIEQCRKLKALLFPNEP